MLRFNNRSFLISGLIICAVFSQTYVYAQSLTGNQTPPKELKVYVTSEGDPLGYAYVFINGRVFGSADSTGVAYVPKSQLKTGDTLSVSFVGTEPKFLIYDKELAGKQMAAFDLISNTNIDEVVVVAKDRSMQLFRKYVNIKMTYLQFFEYKIEYRTHTNGEIENTGTFTINSLSELYAKITGEKHIVFSDNISPKVVWDVSRIFGCANNAVAMKKWLVINEDIIIRYKGKNNGKHIFLIIRPFINNDSRWDAESNQTLIFADERSKEIVAAQSDIVYNNGDIISVSAASYQLYGKGQMEMLHPKKVSGTITRKGENGEQKIMVEIDNVSVKPYKRTKIPKSKQAAKSQ